MSKEAKKIEHALVNIRNVLEHLTTEICRVADLMATRNNEEFGIVEAKGEG